MDKVSLKQTSENLKFSPWSAGTKQVSRVLYLVILVTILNLQRVSAHMKETRLMDSLTRLGRELVAAQNTTNPVLLIRRAPFKLGGLKLWDDATLSASNSHNISENSLVPGLGTGQRACTDIDCTACRPHKTVAKSHRSGITMTRSGGSDKPHGFMPPKQIHARTRQQMKLQHQNFSNGQVQHSDICEKLKLQIVTSDTCLLSTLCSSPSQKIACDWELHESGYSIAADAIVSKHSRQARVTTCNMKEYQGQRSCQYSRLHSDANLVLMDP